MQDDAEIVCLGVCEHNELEICWRLVVVQFVLAGAVGDEASRVSPWRCLRRSGAGILVVRSTKLANHVAQREDGPEDQLCIVGRAEATDS